MQKLKLPDFDYRVREDQIWCIVRRKWVALTPEEWVRQHFLNLLISHLDYPRGMIKLEKSMSYFKSQKRSDIVVLDKEGASFLLVECKAPEVALNTHVTHQLSTYNKVLDARYVAITNGLKHFVWERSGEGFEQIERFPIYG